MSLVPPSEGDAHRLADEVLRLGQRMSLLAVHEAQGRAAAERADVDQRLAGVGDRGHHVDLAHPRDGGDTGQQRLHGLRRSLDRLQLHVQAVLGEVAARDREQFGRERQRLQRQIAQERGLLAAARTGGARTAPRQQGSACRGDGHHEERSAVEGG
ncbi:hypothetical protein LUX57_49120 [Actinomadura madurae]|nr:hypothetical protein [Actinomadura madurae]MCP9972071.1 hypothetical protein [Actinomadura madurae]